MSSENWYCLADFLPLSRLMVLSAGPSVKCSSAGLAAEHAGVAAAAAGRGTAKAASANPVASMNCFDIFPPYARMMSSGPGCGTGLFAIVRSQGWYRYRYFVLCNGPHRLVGGTTRLGHFTLSSVRSEFFSTR